MKPEEGTSQTQLQDKEPVSQENAPVPPRRSARVQAVVAIFMLVCIIVGGFLIVKSNGSSPSAPTASSNPVNLPKPWCAAPASLSANFSGTSISGLAADDVWSVGAQIMHWTGNTWTTVYSPSPQDTLRSIVELGPQNVWAVGEQQTNGLASHPFILHWDGSNWSSASVPDAVPGGKNALVAVSGIASVGVWAVGFVVPKEGPIATLIEHLDGSQWSVQTPQDIGVGTQFTSVKALSDTDVWAIGYTSTIQAGKSMLVPVTEHWNGTKWTSVATPSLAGLGGGNGSASLYNIDGSSANDLWVVGSVNNGMLTEHWDGKSWTLVSSPSVVPTSSNWLSSVAVMAPNDVWAVGRVGNGASGFQPYIEHWDGHQWTTEEDPTQGAGELDVVKTIGNQYWIVGIPNTSGGHAFIETVCP